MNKQETLNQLNQQVPQTYIKQLNKGGSVIDYIPWYKLCDLLDQRTDEWQWEIVSMTLSQDRIFMVGKLTIFADDGVMIQSATGTELLNCSSYGDPSSNAEAMCLRRACAKFGMGRELWDKDTKTKTQTRQVRQPKPSNTRQVKGTLTREEFLAKFPNALR